MTEPAVDLSMHTRKRQFCFVVVKGVDLFIELPAFCTVACVAADFKVRSVRRVLLRSRQDKYEEVDQK
jgi:hypothetical protein